MREIIKRPKMPTSVDTVEVIVGNGEIITPDGEVLPASEASSDSLVAWHTIAAEMIRIAREMQAQSEGELQHRIRSQAGPVSTKYGTARESISRGSISGLAASRIRDVLEKHAADGTIPWEAVDNVAPLVPKVTPAKVSQYAEDAPEIVSSDLEALLPEKRRTVKVDPARS